MPFRPQKGQIAPEASPKYGGWGGGGGGGGGGGVCVCVCGGGGVGRGAGNWVKLILLVGSHVVKIQNDFSARI